MAIASELDIDGSQATGRIRIYVILADSYLVQYRGRGVYWYTIVAC